MFVNKITFGFVATVLTFLLASSALAVSFDSEYELVSVDTYGQPVNYSNDTGFYIWSTSENRRDWSVRWTAPTADTTPVTFSGTIGLSANEFSEIDEFLFESNDNLLPLNMNNDSFQLIAYTNNTGGVDGFDFSIIGDQSPSYLGFDLFIDGNSDISSMIFLGEGAFNPESHDFKIAAPVPEPATLLLLGSGLIGLAYVRRRKK